MNSKIIKKDLIKQNINFLEYPLWFQDEKLAEKREDGFFWRDIEGYVFHSGYKVPVKTDATFLLYFLLQSQRNNHAEEVVVTRYQVIKECELGLNSKWYKRLKESLDRWLRVDVTFKGKFFDGKEYQHIAFHIIDSWKIEEKTKILRVKFNSDFLTMMKGKGFFKYVNFNEFKALRTSLATRLYEILSKSFHHRDTWPISAILLAKKIPMHEKYPAHIIPKVRAALTTINKKTTSTFEVEVSREEKGKAVLIFKKLPDSKPQVRISEKTNPNIDKEEFQKLVAILPWERQKQKSLLEMLHGACKKHSYDYVLWNIKYANKRAIGNYPAYLKKALAENYGESLKEEAEVLEILLTKKQVEEKKKTEKVDEQKAKADKNFEKVDEYLKNISETELETLEREAFNKLPSFLRKDFEKIRQEKPVSFVGILRFIVLKKLFPGKNESQ